VCIVVVLIVILTHLLTVSVHWNNAVFTLVTTYTEHIIVSFNYCI